MARFTQKSKLTSSGLINRMPGKAKLINNTKTPFFQEYQQAKDIENFVVEEVDPVTGDVTKGYVPGAPGTVSRERGTIEETFATITPEQMAKVIAEGFTGDLPGYKQYVEGYNKGTLPSQIKNFAGEVTINKGTPDREVISDEFKGLYKLQQRLRAGTIQGGPDAWFKVLNDRGIDPKSEGLRNYMQTQKGFATKRNEKEEEKQKRREYCKQNPDECRKRSSSKPTTTTRTIKGNPDSETYIVPTVQN